MPGYRDLASVMTARRDIRLFRRFSNMNIENLLQMQAELMSLQTLIDEMRKDPVLNGFDRSWVDAEDGPHAHTTKGIIQQSRVLLDQYYKAILHTRQIEALRPPRKDSVELLQTWYDHESGGNGFLHGVEAAIFRDEDAEADLMTLGPTPGDDDALAKFIGRKIAPLYHLLIGRKIHRRIGGEGFGDAYEYREESLIRLANAGCMLLSAIIPVLSILVLFSVKSMEARLIAISLMSFFFSLIMAIIAQRRADVFMSTTAFAAVLVVFVGSSNAIND